MAIGRGVRCPAVWRDRVLATSLGVKRLGAAKERPRSVNWFTHPTRGDRYRIGANARGGTDGRFGCTLPPRLFASHFKPLQGRLFVLLVGPGTRCGDHSDDRAGDPELDVVSHRMMCPPLTGFNSAAACLTKRSPQSQHYVRLSFSAWASLRRGLAPHRSQYGKRHNRRRDVEDRSNHENCRPTTGPSRQHVAQWN
jgi:hypothetical protein